MFYVYRSSRCGGFTTRPERVTRSVGECTVFGWPAWVDTAVVGLVGVEGSAGRFSGSGVENFGDVWFTGSA